MKLPNPSRLQCSVMLVVVLGITLFAGLRPKEYDFRNNVERSDDGSALIFRKFGVAYTGAIFDKELAQQLSDDGFSISMTIGPEAEEQEGFAFIAQIYSGDPRTQLIVGRWADYLIVMNGDDYRHRFRQPRISARLSRAQRNNGVEILIKSGSRGSVIELKDQLVVRRSDVMLKIPLSPDRARIVLGNSASGKHSWSGGFREFEIRGKDDDSEPVIRFDMSQSARGGVAGEGTASATLFVPVRDVVVEKHLLEWPIDHQFEFNRSFISDVLWNLFGFMPIGFALVFFFRSCGKKSLVPSIAVSIVCAGLLSVLIETGQIWLPSRSSSSLDLLLNVVGGFFGATAVVLVDRLGLKTKTAG